MIVSLIVAMDEKGGIGKNDRLPWHLRSDLQRFKKLTVGHHVIMGRKTYEAIGKPLPGRRMVVITHQSEYNAEGCQVVHSIGEALYLASSSQESEVFIIGGGEIFPQAIDLADKVYLTIVHTDAHADVFIPKLNPNHWSEIYTESTPQNAHDDYPSDFMILIRKIF